MKRKWIYIVLSLTLSAWLFSGCGTPGSSDIQSQDNQVEAPPELSDDTENTNEEQTSPNTESPVTESPVTDPISEEIDLSELADMEKAFDALMLGCLENDMTYDNQNPFFFWTALYYGITNHTEEIPLAEDTTDGIRISGNALLEFATALFAGSDQLPQLPGELTTITYDADYDAYIFTPGDRSQLSTRLLNTFRNEDGSITAAAALYDSETGTPVCCYLFTLSSNPYAEGTTEPVFSYSVSGMTRSPAVNCSDELPTLIGSYQGFSDNHTAEFIIDGNLMAFQVYDKEIVSILYLLEEDTEVTFAVEIDELTESRTIISLIGK